MIDMLVRKQLTLLSYRTWIDANDRRALQLYQDNLNYGFVGAMCLTQAAETFHHWQVFASGDAGVCVVFNRARFEALFAARPHFRARSMEYVLLDQIDEIEAVDIDRLPFLKRWGFRDEREFRVIGFAVEQCNSLCAGFEPSLVERVIMSPFAHPNLVESARAALQNIPGWEGLRIVRSQLTDNQSWQTALTSFVQRHGVFYGPWIETQFDFSGE
ncbi:hypothetical protein GON01_12675 [Sphingomonas sp. MAH-20]|uniref:DUF2971 domain-containing protein n=1 Tax=Sphingomonas horti TaxID=2682842 RepID=A0A6I4J3F7_9SPHN|nr:hypothetical protein [Sphingomonas horti]